MQVSMAAETYFHTRAYLREAGACIRGLTVQQHPPRPLREVSSATMRMVIGLSAALLALPYILTWRA